jgi:hypothetical protein
MAVDILETQVVHEAMILGRMRCAVTGGNGLSDQAVHLSPAFTAQANDELIGLLRIRERLVDQRLENGSVVSMAWMVPSTICMNAVFSPLSRGSNLKPSAKKKALDLSRSFTGRFRTIWLFIASPWVGWMGVSDRGCQFRVAILNS